MRQTHSVSGVRNMTNEYKNLVVESEGRKEPLKNPGRRII
jgi:hypothetical protein